MVDIVSTLQAFGISNNPSLNALFLSIVVPTLVAYVSVMTTTVQTVLRSALLYVASCVWCWLCDWLLGIKVCTLAIDKNNVLFEPIMESAFNNVQTTQSEQNASMLYCLMGMFESLGGESKKKEGSGTTFNILGCSMNIHQNFDDDKCAFTISNKGTASDKSASFTTLFEGDKFSLRLSVEKRYTYGQVDTKSKRDSSDSNDMECADIYQPENYIKLEVRCFHSNVQRGMTNERLSELLHHFFQRHLHIAEFMTFTYIMTMRNQNELINCIKTGMSNLTTSAYGHIAIGDDEKPAFLKANVATPDCVKQFAPEMQHMVVTGDIMVGMDNSASVTLVTQTSRNGGICVNSMIKKFCPSIINDKTDVNRRRVYYFDKGRLVFVVAADDAKTNTRHLHMAVVSPTRLTDAQLRAHALLFIEKTKFAQKRPDKEQKQIYIYRYNNGCGWCSAPMEPRSMSTLYLSPAVEHELVGEVTNFINLRDMHKRLQLPFKLGMLLYGPPGTGKTTAIKALASHFHMNVYLLDVNDPKVNDNTICSILNDLGSSSEMRIVAIEDIDHAFAEKEKVAQEARVLKDKNNKEATTTAFLTYGGLLQALDGLTSNQMGIITIMTTNHIERLGDAIMREGRMDIKCYMGDCCRVQIETMVTTMLKERLSVPELPRLDLSLSDLAVRAQEFANHFCARKHANVASPDDASHLRPCRLQNYIMSRILRVFPVFEDWEQLMEPDVLHTEGTNAWMCMPRTTGNTLAENTSGANSIAVGMRALQP